MVIRNLMSSAVISLGLVLAIWPQFGRTQSDSAQSDREFVFTDLQGHLMVRFVGTGATGLDSSQVEEIVNAELSDMVHDRLRADLLFQDEPGDPEWSATMAPQIEEHVRHAGPEFSDIYTECRAASCRVIMEQPVHWTVPDHRVVLETVQSSLEAFVAARPQHFEPIFMITAYYKDTETSHIKAFLRRAAPASPVLRDR
jgi:hypothetical protein